ncbi:ShlB/FhaC/HecB family hemolysin secretion/activation protein [Gluconacetobacter diazotrophicus]|uniref:ShlB/FhaC/HecB family hemolysin secretion/activation protein n=1 Tax=Gluconacetobacter diazotrophicus TaxID=33996 RepID=A0A7W4I3F8_GLUDI|nr:ShlB/FhaC/HecB family hemolysin secretion/activation protein [Gluconacetobacter diazotrophicus]MBB2154817.1 ShlB/FhaC/HecB family hemolysin secretion/activation protein [Gluconacetobacter diazotrophicus]
MKITTRNYLRSAAAMAAISVGAGMTIGAHKAHAQAWDRVAPKEVTTAPPDIVSSPPITHANILPDTAKIVIQKLRGIQFLDGACLDAKSPDDNTSVSAPAGIRHDASLTTLNDPAFTASLEKRMGKPMTLADINAIATAVNALYRAQGRPFVYVSVPRQFLGHGTIQFQVVEYRIGAVKVDGNRWFSSDLIRQQSGLTPGQLLTLDDVQTGVDRLNGNPFCNVDALFSPGDAAGQTDVTLRTKDRLPLHVYGSYDTGGIPLMGRQEWALGGSYGNLFGLGHVISYQFTHSASDLYSSHAINYEAPLPWGDRIQVFGTYAWERPREYVSGVQMDEKGHSGQASIRYIHDFRPVRFLDDKLTLWQELQGGFDFKTTNNSIEFGGQSVYAAEANTAQFPIIYSATLRDPWGETVFRNQLVLSPGGMLSGNDRKAFDTLVPGASPRYAYDTMSLTRTTWLPMNMSWTMAATGQVATGNLMYSNQIGLGGLYTTRGYFTDSALGSQGVTVQNEVRSPAWHLYKDWDTEQIGAFFDYGHVSQVKAIQNGVSSLDLASAGIDTKFNVKDYLDVSFNVGWRLENLPVTRRDAGYGGKGAFGNVAITAGF